MKIEVGKKYKATNHDGVTVEGIITKYDGMRVEFGKTGRLYLLIPGWKFVEVSK